MTSATTVYNESSNWWKAGAIAAALLAPFLIYFATARSIVAIWNSSETFAHGYIILPISLWLIWKKRATLAQMTPTPFWPGLILLAACGFGWLLAELGDVQVVRQYTFVAMIPIAAVTILGLQISWLLAFPLAFLLLAVPFGEIFIDPLIGFTADFTVAAVEATGIPVLREGANFTLPTGNWSVVEACSGVRYLISSVTLGCLYAYLTYRSRWRQALFVLLSIIVPIVANGLRAYMIVMIGHYSGMQLAVGVDHLIYGWIFFGVVMFLMFWIGSFWREDDQPDSTISASGFGLSSGTASDRQVAAAALAAIVCMGIWPAYAAYLDRAGFNPAPVELSSFQSRWQETSAFAEWKPRFYTPSAQTQRFFQQGQQKAGLNLLYYRNQHHGAELISSENRLVVDKDAHWRRVGNSARLESIGGRSLAVRETLLQGGAGPMLVWHWYWIGERFTTSDYVGKLLQAKERLLVHGDDSAAVMVFAPYSDKPEEARTTLRAFLADHLAPLETALAANKQPSAARK